MIVSANINRKIYQAGKGFTLIEILMVLLLISILVMGINAAYGQAHAFWARITAAQPIYNQSRTVLDTLRQELSSLYLPQADQDDQSDQPPIFFSVNSGNKITFLTLSPAFNSNPVIARPAKVTYTFDDSSDAVNSLVRSEQIFSGEKAIGIGTQTQTILTGLENVIFEVMDNNSEDQSWKDSLQSKDKPPKAVKIQIIWPEEKYRSQTVFQAVLPIICESAL